ncbi:MAG TPA: NAD-dependent epimerase/dehydratase family protein [Thermotogota bacterium]|jgi:nucleoside-diphosphate-sugar epimerase|nr:MAG: UDP-glucose 4-epimerase [Thermotogota bacterium ADurb.Bin062]HNW47557.1 NAD-dependent epimerase/dehydratase family protein [Thermotogota bacterium]HOE75723.1 NAD-dependent epimerase/dehydratase family protein [Rectinema sp.]HOD91895.1 NAD-dependent epimerase/dehydratase family protein [Thermotogota bacterium]HOS25631.1 NAD-dependent epimerase/dehydratase family protein [Thermotogota bacterium]
MRILITGGAGCLGSNLVEHWIPAGHEILVIDNFTTGKREVLPEIGGLYVKEGSVADGKLMEEAFGSFEPEVVVHSAASYKDPKNWIEDTATNVMGAVLVAKESIRKGVKRIINFQTALCYGHPQQIPVPVNHPLAPFTSYGISKTAGELYLLLAKLPVISLRLANICGPRLAIGPIPTFYKRLKAERDCFCSDTVRDFMDISDFFTLMDELLVISDLPTGVFNVSTGEGHSIKEVYDIVAKFLGIKPPEVPIISPGIDDVAVMVLDPTQTERILGWKTSVSFEETITRQLKWYEAHGVSDVFSHLMQPGKKERDEC